MQLPVACSDLAPLGKSYGVTASYLLLQSTINADASPQIPHSLTLNNRNPKNTTASPFQVAFTAFSPPKLDANIYIFCITLPHFSVSRNSLLGLCVCSYIWHCETIFLLACERWKRTHHNHSSVGSLSLLQQMLKSYYRCTRVYMALNGLAHPYLANCLSFCTPLGHWALQH